MKFVLASGGSGGHLIPAIKVAQELKNQNHSIVFIGSFKVGSQLLVKNNFQFEQLNAEGLKRGLIQKTRAIFSLIYATFKSIGLLIKYKPDVVIGFGGYGAFPVLLAASLLNKPTLLHEQNVVPGRANSVLKYFVRKIALTFKESTKYFPLNKTVVTGCPCNLPLKNFDRNKALSSFNLNQKHPVILVFGGSQGSHKINQIFVEVAIELAKECAFQIIHICGKNDYDLVNYGYKNSKLNYAVYEFFEDMPLAYGVADLVISRAGAVTVTELEIYKLNSILIPYPFAGAHQLENAKVLKNAGLAEIIEERELTKEKLKEAIIKKISYKVSRKINNSMNQDSIFDAASRIADEAVKLIK